MVTQVNNFDKFYVMMWKNFCVYLHNYKGTLLGIFIPPIFCIVLILLRVVVEIQHRPEKQFRMMPPNYGWQNLLELFEHRKEVIQQKKPDFQYNPFVPQLYIAFAPNTQLVSQIMQNAIIDDLPGVESLSFDNCTELKARMMYEHYLAGVCFNIVDSPSMKHLVYEIVYPSELRIFNDSYIGGTWNTNLLYDIYNSDDERQMPNPNGGFVGYIREGFAAIQNAIAISYLRLLVNDDVISPQICRFPIYAHDFDPLIHNIKISISLTLICGFLLPALNITNRIVWEKESKMRKILKSLDVDNWIILLAWFTIAFLLMFVSVLFIVLLFKIPWMDGNSILTHSSPWALILCLLFYLMAAICFCLMMSAFFSRAKLAVPLVGIAWLCTYLPYVASSVNSNWHSHLHPLTYCFCNTVLGLMFDQIVDFERYDGGFFFSNITSNPTEKHALRVGTYLAILTLESVVYVLIGLYVEQLNFGAWNVRKYWNFIFGARKKKSETPNNTTSPLRHTKIYEIEPEHKKVTIKTVNLSKAYLGTTVVKHVNMNIYLGDITVLMGHNGAGKTTFLEMIAGMVTPTHGKIIIDGLDAKRHKNVHKHMGISMHEWLLFPELGVQDHLTIFSRLRGLVSHELEKDVEKYLTAMHMMNRPNEPIKNLSNGERQFLTVCCALAGECKVVLLDEPSQGLDLVNRKALWELLRNERRQRTILMTSQHEEEAETLADRVAIMSGGELKCFGSTFFLKKVYGHGHRLTCSKGKNCQPQILTELIKSHIPGISPESQIGKKISYVLEDTDIDKFTALFDELEANVTQLDIESITISEICAGDIFLKMGAEELNEGERMRYGQLLSQYSRYRYMDESERQSGVGLWFNHCEALMLKRLISATRTTLLGVVQLIMPILFTVISFSLLNYNFQRDPLPAMKFSLDQYHEAMTVVAPRFDINESAVNWKIYKAYAEWIFWLGLPHHYEEAPMAQGFNKYMIDKQKHSTELVNNKYLAGVSISKDTIIAYFNNYPLHTVPLTLNLVHNAMARALLDSNTRIEVTLSPLPYASEHDIILKDVPACIGNYLAINVTFCVAFTWSLSVIFLVRERKENFKFLQFLSGVNGFTFWLTTFFYDFLAILITSLIILLTIVIFELDTFMEERPSGEYFFVLVIAGACLCSSNYFLSSINGHPIHAYIAITIFNIFGTMTYWTYLEVTNKGFQITNLKGHYKYVVRLFPHFSLCNALVKIFDNAEIVKVCQDNDTSIISKAFENCSLIPQCCALPSSWHWQEGFLIDVLYLFAFGVICWILLWLKETCPSWRRNFNYDPARDDSIIAFTNFTSRHSTNEPFPDNNSVSEEAWRIAKMNDVDYERKILVCDRLGYRRQKHVIVNQISFAIDEPECFGLLGANASGKSTLLQLLTGRKHATTGDAFICGVNVRSDIKKTFPLIGYCPQTDLGLPEFAIFEIMRMICLLKGIPNTNVAHICENLSKILGFYTHLHKKLKRCSKGTKRRFTCALAMLGNPQLMFFDDPAASIDIGGRRQLYNTMYRLRQLGHTIVFTSNRTEGCEALCERMTIMSKGRLVVIDNPWNLNLAYANGYLLEMKIKKIMIKIPNTAEDWLAPSYRTYSANPFLRLATFIENEFPRSRIKEQCGNTVIYFIPYYTTAMSKLFRTMQRNAFNLYIEHFRVTRSAFSTILLEAIEKERSE